MRVSSEARAKRLFPGLVVTCLLAIVAGSAALAVDPSHEGYGLKGDEATYISMALSVAFDGDLRFDPRDLQRFWKTYGSGPEGIFLKRGAPLVPTLRAFWPPVTFAPAPERRRERLYYAKAFLYGVVGAPFVIVWGVNGLLLMNVLLLAGVMFVGYVYLSAQGPSRGALLLATAFFGASCSAVYAVWMTPEILNLSLVFFAYFLWAYKAVAPVPSSRWTLWLRHPRTDLVAAVLLGLAIYSKPPNLLLIVPVGVVHIWQRRTWAGLSTTVVCAATVAVAFGATALIVGDANYQGGERKSFYETFPFQSRALTFESSGVDMATNAVVDDDPFEPEVFWPRLRANAWYFLAGRHFGFVPYFFPGVVVLFSVAVAWRRVGLWRLTILGVLGVTTVWFLVFLPFSWSGGGGPVGNRYFLSVYPAVFFLMPAFKTIWPGMVAWVGSALFIAHILVQPHYASRFPWVTSQRGLLRALPVEVTMADDLPVRLTLQRSRLDYGDPRMLLYLITEDAYNPEAGGMWISGRGKAEILVRSAKRGRLRLTFTSPIDNVVHVSAGRDLQTVHLAAGQTAEVSVEVRWIAARQGSAAFLLSVRVDRGFAPKLIDQRSQDLRWLGAFMNFAVVGPDE